MFIKQISVFMENRPGRLAEITQVLSDNNIDMRAINIADTTDFGILRMIVDDAEKAEKVLRENNMTASVTDVLAVSIDDTVGAFSKVIALLKEENISIEYIYSFIGEKSAKAVIVIKTNDAERSFQLLQQGGIHVLSSDDLNNLSYAK
ncbi:ACT domain-containing protein [Ructibacterium gallinarum]|uniref:ACT domain-containing protein n=1 Tax=Ructibacterium gallinarum TaxID=2779355 RepID=A0A9D5RB38_9FIRM|nr:ACT domain-containing protein [Ructibacterium gallinarum]MBE5039658.1 ACT domain-containing protein [Ructibacterium gallinarum]